jgi:hypothetical protein
MVLGTLIALSSPRPGTRGRRKAVAEKAAAIEA